MRPSGRNKLSMVVRMYECSKPHLLDDSKNVE